jgi:hypothetical protein
MRPSPTHNLLSLVDGEGFLEGVAFPNSVLMGEQLAAACWA